MPFNSQVFNNLDETRPVGTQYVSVIDDFMRDTRSYIKYALALISGYPDNSILRMCTWTTSSRPNIALKEGMFGYNSDTKRLEFVNNGAWEPIYLRVDNASTIGDEASGNHVDIFTGDTNSKPTDNLRPGKTMYYDIDLRRWFCYYSTGWKANGAVYIPNVTS